MVRLGLGRVELVRMTLVLLLLFLCCSAAQCDKHLIWRPWLETRDSSSTRPCNRNSFARMLFLTVHPPKLPCLPGAACYQVIIGGKWCGFLLLRDT